MPIRVAVTYSIHLSTRPNARALGVEIQFYLILCHHNFQLSPRCRYFVRAFGMILYSPPFLPVSNALVLKNILIFNIFIEIILNLNSY